MAIERNVRVKVRFSILEEEIPLRGHPQRRPGKRPVQSKHVQDLLSMELPVGEWHQRLEDAGEVIMKGWELAGVPPPEVFLGDIQVDAVNEISMSGKVVSNDVATTCGFEMDLNPEFSTAATELADESDVTDADPVKINASFDAFFFQGLTFYIRAFADDGTKLVYSIVKSVFIPILP